MLLSQLPLGESRFTCFASLSMSTLFLGLEMLNFHETCSPQPCLNQALFKEWFFPGVGHAIACGYGCGNVGEGSMWGCGGGFCCSAPQYGQGRGAGRGGTHTGRRTQEHTHTHTEERTRECCTYPLSEEVVGVPLEGHSGLE